jgi:hypothetical protein
MKKYSFTDHPEHKEQLKPWADKWIANAMSTVGMTEIDREICRDAVRRLYAAANLTPPSPERIIFVPSPFVLRFAAGFAAEIWRKRAHATADCASYAATVAATHASTENTTSATDFSTWYVYPGDMRQCADVLGVGVGGLRSARNSYNSWQGGNQWSASDSCISFFRHVAKLPIDYTKWDAWETLSLHSGPRIVHEKFCIISDRPEILLVDDQNRPHCETGPFCRWRDGSALYSYHGARVPARWIEERATIDPAEIIAHENVEFRAAGAAIIGWPRMLSALNSKTIDDSGNEEIGALIELKLPGLKKPGRFLKAMCPRNGLIVEGVPYIDDYGEEIKTALHAQAWRVGDRLSEYLPPEVRT